MVRSIDWLKQSEAEFKAATDLLNTNNFAWCCFTAQQSAEKSIKAILNHFQSGRVRVQLKHAHSRS